MVSQLIMLPKRVPVDGGRRAGRGPGARLVAFRLVRWEAGRGDRGERGLHCPGGAEWWPRRRSARAAWRSVWKPAMVQRRSKAVGFGGEYLIHPAQIVPVHRVFSPV